MIDDPNMQAPRDGEDDAGIAAEDKQFSDDHPLASPNELAGDAASGIELEFLARDVAEAEADAEGAASGIMLEEDTLPLDGE